MKKTSPQPIAATAPDAMRKALHELQVHQIELEMQKEELLRTRAEIDAMRARYCDLYDQAPVGYVTLNESGQIVEANLTAATLLGVARGVLINHSITDFIHRDDQDGFYLHRQQLFDSEDAQVCDLRMVRPDGASFWVHLAAVIVRNAEGEPRCRAIMSDITAHKQVELDLRESEARYRESFELAVDGILLGSPDGIIIGANAQMQKLAGRSLEQLLGRHVTDLFDPKELVAKPLRFDLLNESRLFMHERNLLRPDGTCLSVEMHSKRMPDGTYQSIYCDISERKRTQDALRESNELLSRFMRDSPIYSFIKTVTPHGSRVLFASENFQQMIGIPGSEMVGKTTAELFPAEIAAKIDADDRLVVSNREMSKIEEDLYGRHYSSIKFPIVLGKRILLAGYTIDVTEQKQASQIMREWNQALEQRVAERTLELQQSKARFRQLAEATFEGIAITEGGVLVDGNAQLGLLHGCNLADLIGRPIVEIIAPESRALVAGRMSVGEESTYEFVGLRKDGSRFAAEVHGRPGTWLGRPTRISAIRDLSENKELAAKLQAQQTELEHAQRLSLVSEISAGIIHQISQPLCVIGVNASVAISRLQGCPLNTCGILEILKDLEVAVANTRDTVTHLRTLVRPELRLASMPIDFNAWIEQVLRLLRHEADIRKVSLAVDLNPHLPQVLVDSVQLHQVILILIHNAFDACATSPPERRVVAITTRALADDAVELSVCDAGKGLAPEAMTRLFEPFFTTKAQGMGIGLRLCRTIVQAHGGSLEGCNNADGIGATFRVTLPCHAERNYTKV